MLEAARVADPVRAMIASGRMPNTVGGIMSPVITVKNHEMVNVAMHQMIEKGVNAVMVEPDASGHWGIMTDRDVLKRSSASTGRRRESRSVKSRPGHWSRPSGKWRWPRRRNG